jgi:hypothetical protein
VAVGVIAAVAIGQAPQALAYVPGAVPEGDGRQGLQPLGVSGQATRLALVPRGGGIAGAKAPTSVTLFDQGLLQVLQASATGLSDAIW